MGGASSGKATGSVAVLSLERAPQCPPPPPPCATAAVHALPCDATASRHALAADAAATGAGAEAAISTLGTGLASGVSVAIAAAAAPADGRIVGSARGIALDADTCMGKPVSGVSAAI